MLPVRAWRRRARARPRRLLHRLADLDRTSAFYRIAERHQQARVSRRLLALAVIVLVAVLATRAAAGAPAPPAPVPAAAVPSDCDGELGCAESGDDEDDAAPGDPDLVTEAPGVIPRVVSAGPARARTASRGGEPCACPSTLPLAIEEVAAAAVRAAGLAHDPAPSWSTRTRLAGLVPMFSARYGRNLSWKDVDDPTLGYTNMYDLRATWHLDRLLFDQNEIRIAAIDVGRRREKRRVEMLAVHTYLAWLQLPRASARAVLLASDLDAITDGWFSRALAKRGKP